MTTKKRNELWNNSGKRSSNVMKRNAYNDPQNQNDATTRDWKEKQKKKESAKPKRTRKKKKRGYGGRSRHEISVAKTLISVEQLTRLVYSSKKQAEKYIVNRWVD